MEEVKNELLNSMEKMFDDLMQDDNITYDKVRYQIDYMVYPGIGSYIADGSLTKEEAKEVFTLCENRLKELKSALSNKE
ncbi:MAG: pyruvate carboxylase subunit B [Archaeoglobaceae archaeon]